MKITYFHTLYNRNVTKITDEIKFLEDGTAVFFSGGHGYLVRIDRIRKIEKIGNGI